MIEAARQLFEEHWEKNGNFPERALAETIQYIALLGISRTDFFVHAAFYGGTALRMLFGLDRFSEDLDFSLVKPVKDFTFGDYLKSIEDELESYGFTIQIVKREKAVTTAVESAFIKADTKVHLIETRAPEAVTEKIPKNAVCKVKLEIDIDPPPYASFDVRYVDDPVPFSICSYDTGSLFAGKTAALLARQWKVRVKGRDWYDFDFFVRKNIPLSLKHLESRLRQIGYYEKKEALDGPGVRELLEKRVLDGDQNAAKRDVIPFIRNPKDLDVWTKDYFMHLVQRVEVE
jgi:hypothetical protein